MTPIIPNSAPAPIAGLSLTPASGKSEQAGESFKDLMLESLKHVNSMQHDADQAVEQLMTGGDVDPAEVLTAIQKSDMTFRMMLQIRNKLVQAYQEVNQIRI